MTQSPRGPHLAPPPFPEHSSDFLKLPHFPVGDRARLSPGYSSRSNRELPTMAEALSLQLLTLCETPTPFPLGPWLGWGLPEGRCGVIKRP